jgi:5-methylcytosine-specific restriction protein A
VPRAGRLCSQPGCLNPAVRNGRCQEHPWQRYGDPWERNQPYGPRIPARRRLAVLAVARFTCAQCGAGATEVDHITPRHQGGGDSVDNLRALCTSCHAAKTAAEGQQALRDQRQKGHH